VTDRIRSRRRLTVLAATLCLGLTLASGPALAHTEPPDVTAVGAVLWDPFDEKVLFGKREREPRPPASTTKIMTVLLAIEAGTLDDTVTVSPRAASVGGASLGLVNGQPMPMRSLLAGLILRSGNDGAVAVAEHVAGSESAFVDRMNERAGQLGMTETYFVNASGLTADPRHVSSPLDLVRLAQVAMRQAEFAAWAGAAQLAVPGLPPMQSRNLLLGSYDGATGVKTGYLAQAGFTLVASAHRDGRDLFAVVLGSDDSFRDAAALLDHGFVGFRRPMPLGGGSEATRYRWADADVAAIAEEELAVTVSADAVVVWRTDLVPAVPRPVAAGTQIGTASLLVDGAVQRVTPLIAGDDVGAPPPRRPAVTVGAAVQETLRTFVRLQTVDRAA
jgi:serine-type D-Ala-D-Ala carboxypeptidase (penicillin-binding protein 5/6)